ncbi:MAG: preprotein translocase subunit SecY [Candidatus Makana argininalis]
MYKKRKLKYINSKIGFHELKKRIIFVIISLVILRIGSCIQIPFININIFKKIINNNNNFIINMFNIFSGGSLNHASIFSLGVMPYISSSMIIQLITKLNKNYFENKINFQNNKHQINKYILYGSFIISIIQSLITVIGFNNLYKTNKYITNSIYLIFFITTVISLTLGTMLLIWIGNKITKKGIGNGISFIIFTGIISELYFTYIKLINKIHKGDITYIMLIFIIFLLFSIIFFIVLIESGQRQILINYPNHQGRKFFTSENTYLPLKFNMNGVITTVFSSNLITIIFTIITWIKNQYKLNCISFILKYFKPGNIIYTIIYFYIIKFFCFFYSKFIFDSKELSDNIKKSGAFITGIRPGLNTENYILKIYNKITFIGSIYVTFICLIMEIINKIINFKINCSGTSLLIIVVVIIDFINQINTIMMSSKYKEIIKKIETKKKIFY